MKENKADYLTTVNVSIISSSTKGGMSGRGASGESNENGNAPTGGWLLVGPGARAVPLALWAVGDFGSWVGIH